MPGSPEERPLDPSPSGDGAPARLSAYLDYDPEELERRWERLKSWLDQRFERDAGLEGILFLVGIQSQGQGFEPKLNKERKQDLIMEGTYRVFEKLGLYERVGMDEDGAWIWERTGPSLPPLPLEDQETLLRIAIVSYFDEIVPDVS